LTIGALNDGVAPYDEQVGSAKIYPTALTAAEVLQNYDAQKGKWGL
jgi:hypothetical protein